MQPFDIADYCARFRQALLAAFDEKVLYIGLQGSYLRGEAAAASDIDMMVILDTLTIADMDTYRQVVESLGDADRACGFICSRADMGRWNPLEICHLRHTTKDLYGALADFLPPYTMEDEIHYIQMSLNNLYHALCHGYIHANRADMAQGLLPLYKSAFFILQNTHYLETWRKGAPEFAPNKAALLEKLQGQDRAVLQTLLALTGGEPIDFDKHYALLFSWCQEKMAQTV